MVGEGVAAANNEGRVEDSGDDGHLRCFDGKASRSEADDETEKQCASVALALGEERSDYEGGWMS